VARRAADVGSRGRFLYILGRAKEVVIRGGENIYSIAVQNVLAAHPAVGECAVIGTPDACSARSESRCCGWLQEAAPTRPNRGARCANGSSLFKRPRQSTSPPSHCRANARAKILARELKGLFRERFAA
jgi:long-chain acyl-CoA synthetase